jgi:hypothetical protein
MTFVRASLLLLATSGCVKQVAVERPAPDLYHLCNDARFQSLCTPVPAQEPANIPAFQQPIRVDTNLTSPNPTRFGQLG